MTQPNAAGGVRLDEAAVDETVERAADLFARGQGGAVRRAPAIVEGGRLDNEAGRAKAALQRVVRHERFLDRMQARSGNTLDGGYGFSGGVAHLGLATTHGRILYEHGAGAAHADAAAVFRAGEIGDVTEKPQQGHFGIAVESSGFAIHCQLNH